jgi:hypothetical protein
MRQKWDARSRSVRLRKRFFAVPVCLFVDPFMAGAAVISGTQIWAAPVDGDYEWKIAGAVGEQDNAQTSAKPGKGGVVHVVQKGVKAGTKFYIRVGQQGTDQGQETGCGSCGGYTYAGCGGFNGGGHITSYSGPGGATGGGGTDVRMCDNGKSCQVSSWK